MLVCRVFQTIYERLPEDVLAMEKLRRVGDLVRRLYPQFDAPGGCVLIDLLLHWRETFSIPGLSSLGLTEQGCCDVATISDNKQSLVSYQRGDSSDPAGTVIVRAWT